MRLLATPIIMKSARASLMIYEIGLVSLKINGLNYLSKSFVCYQHMNNALLVVYYLVDIKPDGF